MILNNYGLPPQPDDKKIMVVRFFALKWKPLKNSKGGIYYAKLGNAQNKRREEILNMARELNFKSWLYNVFH